MAALLNFFRQKVEAPGKKFFKKVRFFLEKPFHIKFILWTWVRQFWQPCRSFSVERLKIWLKVQKWFKKLNFLRKLFLVSKFHWINRKQFWQSCLFVSSESRGIAAPSVKSLENIIFSKQFSLNQNFLNASRKRFRQTCQCCFSPKCQESFFQNPERMRKYKYFQKIVFRDNVPMNTKIQFWDTFQIFSAQSQKLMKNQNFAYEKVIKMIHSTRKMQFWPVRQIVSETERQELFAQTPEM